MKISESLDWIDTRLFVFVFRPISNFMDKHFHVNPWQLAVYFMMASAVAFVMEIIFVWGRDVGMGWKIFMMASVLFLRGYEILDLSQISERYEKNPSSTLDIRWLKYYAPFQRRWHFYLGFFVFFPANVQAAIHYNASLLDTACGLFARSWFSLAAIAYYFAALPRPPHKRKEKKVWSFGFGKLASVSAK